MISPCNQVRHILGEDVQCLICIVLMSLLSISGAIINGITMFVLLRLKSTSKKKTNKFLITLVVGQLILTLVVAPYHIQQIDNSTENLNCRRIFAKKYINSLILISGVSNGCIAYDRYIQVEFSKSYNDKMKGLLLYFLLALPWVTAFVYVISLAFGDVIHLHHCHIHCRMAMLDAFILLYEDDQNASISI